MNAVENLKKKVKSHQKVKYAQAQHFKSDACVSVIVEPVEYFNAQAVAEIKR